MAVQSPAVTDLPLDPALERVQRRLRRLLLISGLTLGAGLCAVFAAIIYRLNAIPDKAPPVNAAVQEASVAVSAGSRLVSTAVNGDRIVLTYEENGVMRLIIIDARTLAVTGRLELKPE